MPCADQADSGTLRVARKSSRLSKRMLASTCRFVILCTRANFSSTKKDTPYWISPRQSRLRTSAFSCSVRPDSSNGGLEIAGNQFTEGRLTVAPEEAIQLQRLDAVFDVERIRARNVLVPVGIVETGAFAVNLVRQSSGANHDHLQVVREGLDGAPHCLPELVTARRCRLMVLKNVNGDRQDRARPGRFVWPHQGQRELQP
jgi:hypothetical protein